MRTLAAAFVALTLAFPSAAGAKAITIGNGESPSVFVDDAGTAHIVWATTVDNGTDTINYCRLKRAATACDQTQPIPPPVNPLHPEPGAINENGSGPKIYAVGDNLVILDKRTTDEWPDPTGSTFRPELAWVSTDGGNTFTGPNIVAEGAGNIAGPGVVYGPDEDPRIATISQVVTGGTYFQAIAPGVFTDKDANLGDDPSLSRAWYDGNVTLSGGTPVASLADDNGNQLRRLNPGSDGNDLANWSAPTRLPGTEGGRLAGGPKGLLFFDPESTDNGDQYFVHKVNGTSAGPGAQVTHDSGPVGFGRFFQTDGGKTVAVWQQGNWVHEATSTDGTTFPSKSTDVITTPPVAEMDAQAAFDGGGVAVAKQDVVNDGPIVVASFGPTAKTGKPGVGGVPGGGTDPDDDTNVTESCRDIHYEDVDVTPANQASCFFKGKGKNSGYEVTDGAIDVNGLTITPDDKSQTLIAAKKHRIFSTGKVTVTLAKDGSAAAPVVLWHGTIDSNLKGHGKAKAGQVLFDFPMAKFQAKVEGFDVAGELPVLIAAKNGVSLPLNLKLPSAFGGATANVTVTSTSGGGLDVPSLQIGPFDAAVGPLGFTGVTLKWTGGTSWTGSATLDFPGADSFQMHAAITFDAGQFKSGNVTLNSFPGIPVVEGVYLTQVGLGLSLNPTQLTGNVIFGAVPLFDDTFAISVRGDFLIQLGSHTVVSGTGSIVNTDLASATLKYDSDIGFSADANAQIGDDTLGIFANGSFGVGKVDGKLRWGGSADIRGCVVGVCHVFGDVAVNDKGAAVCIDTTPVPFDFDGVKPIFSATVAHDWDDDPFIDPSGGCNVGPYSNPLGNGKVRGAQAGGPTFTVAAGTVAEDVKVRGMGAAPNVTITGPDGQPVKATGRSVDSLQAEFFTLGKPAAGTYTVVAGVGAPIAEVTTARVYGTPTATAKVLSDKGRRRVLSFKVKDRDPNLSIRFLEQLPNGTTHELGESNGSSGILHFTAADGPGGTRAIIAAAVLPDDSIGQSKVIAHYKAPAEPKAGRVGRVRVRRTKTGLHVTWKKASGATSYVVRAKLKGGSVVRFAGVRKLAVDLPGITRKTKATVSVQAIGFGGRKGKARSVKVR